MAPSRSRSVCSCLQAINKSAIDAGCILSGRPGSNVHVTTAAYIEVDFEALRTGCVDARKYVSEYAWI
jgi:hypothetical protein